MLFRISLNVTSFNKILNSYLDHFRFSCEHIYLWNHTLHQIVVQLCFLGLHVSNTNSINNARSFFLNLSIDLINNVIWIILGNHVCSWNHWDQHKLYVIVFEVQIHGYELVWIIKAWYFCHSLVQDFSFWVAKLHHCIHKFLVIDFSFILYLFHS